MQHTEASFTFKDSPSRPYLRLIRFHSRQIAIDHHDLLVENMIIVEQGMPKKNKRDAKENREKVFEI
jgi:hypothetical protein